MEGDFSYYYKRYADVANQISWPSYKTVDLNARFDATDTLSFNLYVNNLFDEIGLTEGNPRAGAIENEEVGKAVYIARSIFGRSLRGALTFRFWFWRPGDVPAVSTFSPEPLETGTRWYRGDLHLHTGESDGFCDSRRGRSVPCPVYLTAEAAVAARLDFIAITDHNNVGTYNAMRELQPYYDDLLLIPGREMTTEQGHANIFGTTEYVDHRLGEKSMPNMAAMTHASHKAGALFSINHPGSPNDYGCRGCGWIAPAQTMAMSDPMEVVNGGKAWSQISGSKDAMGDLAIWEAEIARGHRMTAIGGSDTHDVRLGRLGVGFPTTMVHADSLSERAILDGIKAGHVWIDLTGKPGRSFDLVAQGAGRTGTLGDDYALAAGQSLDISLLVGGSTGAALVGLVDGKPARSLSIDKVSGDGAIPLRWTSDGQRHWIRFEVRQGESRIVVTNPLYVNFEPTASGTPATMHR